jgi:N-acetyl-gamma-glutamylphosphate reductase
MTSQARPVTRLVCGPQVPEINSHAIGNARLIANPNCTTAIAVMALWPLHQHFGIKKIVMSTYQAASGAGKEVRTPRRDPCPCMPVGWFHHESVR